MPKCDFCGIVGATADMRRRRPPHTGHFMCKDKTPCDRRVAEQKAEAKQLRLEAKRGQG